MFFHHMTRLLPRPVIALGASLVALCGFAAVSAPAAAQTAASPAAVSAAPASGATDTATPRRRPTRRSAVRPDTSVVHTASFRTADERSAAERSAMLSLTLRVEGRNWLGIPYRWGGSSRRGIDCSSFTQQFVRETMGIELPRATAGQQYEGVPVSRSELRPGDLVFFRRGGVRHVGVYLGENEFIHASSSNGVTVSNLSERYYARHYWMARRILSEPSGRRPTPRTGARADSSSVRG